jgi:hypothetical protein
MDLILVEYDSKFFQNWVDLEPRTSGSPELIAMIAEADGFSSFWNNLRLSKFLFPSF